MTKIEFNDVDMVYETAAGQQVQALKGFDLGVGSQEFIAIVGPSGCGKTTLLKILAGLLAQTRGEVAVGGDLVRGPSPDRAVVFQDFRLLPWATILDNVAFGLRVQGVGKAARNRRAEQELGRVGLADFAEKYPGELSGGMQQRVGLARALAVDPAILLMDEPFGALDALTRQLLQNDLLELWESQPKTVVFITHSIEEAVLLADRIVVMAASPGRVVDVIDVELDRPRSADTRRSPEFHEYATRIWDLLSRHLDKN